MKTSNKFLRSIQLLHDYRSKKVNPAHLKLEELFNPQKLYNYLRNDHWKDGTPPNFIESLAQMNISNYKLNDSDKLDFEIILKKLGIQFNLKSSTPSEPDPFKIHIKKRTPEAIPSTSKNWKEYK